MDLITINRSVNENDSDIPSNVIKKIEDIKTIYTNLARIVNIIL